MRTGPGTPGLALSHAIRTLSLLPLILMAMATVVHAGSDQLADAPLPLSVQNCFPCHGPAGISRAPAIPALAGLPRTYLLKVLRAYRHGGRFGTVMGRLMQDYTESQLVEMADYFSRQTAVVPKQRVDWDLVRQGRQLHRFYCRQCHGDLRREAEAGTPRLNGRWMAYLRWTLQDYLLGVNQTDDEMSQAMIRLIRRHGERGLEALVHYYGSARPEAEDTP